ncbi:MAG: bifunctional N-acetylglucosamine-1-phosphate uridyltransferase/glucosamine-1-phosphate acetyltransferase [Candidatus Goldbacteria bacterium]|nr:bifunctional N-acetylglucosamine-1-phosphate uridyltransferase/glucosamine-1-phosphate acetyltransferase [Candidatus Goldiibacteriota bacterium]
MKITAIILAAGKGTRMKSCFPKVLHQISGKEMISYVLDSVIKADIKDIVIVAGSNFHKVTNFVKSKYKNIKIIRQKNLLGTGHAVSTALKSGIALNPYILILNGDVPMISPETLKHIINMFTKYACDGIIAVSKVKNPSGYGRIKINDDGNVASIIEEKDATPEEKKIDVINGGLYFFKKQDLTENIFKIKRNAKKGEYYLTDLVDIMVKSGKILKPFFVDELEMKGINDRQQLTEAAAINNKKILEKHLKNGITIKDVNTVFIEDNVIIGKDTVIEPFTIIKGPARIGPFCNIGPFTHIRSDTVIGGNCKIGNYVEIKKSKIGDNVHVSHLSYIGDATIGSGTNIGAGTITANYDGRKKNKTYIGKNVYVGSNVVFVAPVKIGDNAVIGAGSVITENVPSASLAIARQRQINKKNWTLRRSNKK